MNRLSSSSKEICLLSLYIILPTFIKIGQELFEIIDINTDTQTDRHIHAGENNTCPKTKFLGQVTRWGFRHTVGSWTNNGFVPHGFWFMDQLTPPLVIVIFLYIISLVQKLYKSFEKILLIYNRF